MAASRTPHETSEQPLDGILLLTEYELAKKALNQAKIKLEEVINENRQLTEERNASEHESYEVTEFLRRELQQKTTVIEQMQLLVQNTHTETEAKLSETKQQATKEVEEAKQRFRNKEKQLEAKVSSLQTELNEVRKFREKQKELEDVVFGFQKEKKSLEEQLELQKTNSERHFFDETSRLRTEFEHQLSQQKRIAEIEQDQFLDDRVKSILKQNRRLAVELNLHKQETMALHRELRISEEERLRLNKEVELRMGLEEGYAERNARQGIQLRASQTKSESLEKSMKQLVVNMTKISEERQLRNERLVEDLKLETEALRKLIKSKNRECLTLRQLAQQILTQRKEVERFLITSIQMVRKERSQVKFQDKVSKMDFSVESMPWFEREQVLKILLSKLKTGAKFSASDTELMTGILSKEGRAKPT
eukprot:g668.t1